MPKSVFDKEKATNVDPKLIMLNNKTDISQEVSKEKQAPGIVPDR